MTLLADLLATVFDRKAQRIALDAHEGRPVEELADALVDSTSETRGLSLATAILSRFEAMDDTQKLGFFRHLAQDMDIDPVAVRAALDTYESFATGESYRAFTAAAEPRRQELVRRLNSVPQATTSLVRMRADLLRLGRDEPQLAALDLDFRHLFASWFNLGFLVLRPINWESPAHILEKVIAYEAVHQISSWHDLRRRLQPTDRRCFAFFHPAMPDEPLIFVEVALIKGEAGSIQTLLAEDREPISPQDADTAVFYSISNCQAGLAKVSFGSSLIKKVATDLAGELDGLKTFKTLSPIPGLRKWAEQNTVVLDLEQPERIRLIAAHYLLRAKRDDGHPVDPVARFHLANGAIISEVHADADTSEKGRAQSGGAMVNYLYDLSKTTENQELYNARQEVMAKPKITADASQVILTEEGPANG